MVKSQQYLSMSTDEVIQSDLAHIAAAFGDLAGHLGHFGDLIFSLRTFACIAAIYLLILDRTNWRTNILTALLIPYIFLSLPDIVFSIIRGDVGKWLALIGVVLRLFCPRRFPEWLAMFGSLILLVIVAPTLFAETARDHWLGLIVCLVIACYLLQEHIRASGGFRNSFAERHGFSNTIGILLLLVYPIWYLVLHFFSN